MYGLKGHVHMQTDLSVTGSDATQFHGQVWCYAIGMGGREAKIIFWVMAMKSKHIFARKPHCLSFS